jgi:hypothetical protein
LVDYAQRIALGGPMGRIEGPPAVAAKVPAALGIALKSNMTECNISIIEICS